jgi:subtilisin family serine protease
MTNETNDERGITRRETLAGIAGGLGVALGTSPVQAAGTIENQYLLDTRSTDSDAWREEVEIVAEVPEIDMASVRGDPSALEGFRFAEEVKMEVAPPSLPEEAPAAGNSVEPDVSTPEATDGDSPPAPYSLQWDKTAQGVEQLHEDGITGEGTTIAVVDSGIDADHPDLDVNTEKSQNFSAADGLGPVPAEYHGTHVAGIAAANGNNASEDGPYVVGMAPDAELLDMKVFPYLSSASFLNAVRAAVDAGADVVNMSFGPGSPYGPSVQSDLSIDSYRRIGQYARENGALLVESAGNADTNIDAVEETLTNSGKGSVPGFLQVSATGPVTTVSHLEQNGTFGNVAPTTAPAYYTNYGPESIDVSAPGGNVLGSDFDGVLSTMPPEVSGGFTRVGSDGYGEYGTLHGTSMAAPNAAGLAALVKSQNPSASPDQIKQHLKNTAETIEKEPADIMAAFGLTFIGYLGDPVRVGSISNDFELEDPYSSQTYRGDGHIDSARAATKSIPFPGGIEVDGQTYYPADPDDDGLYEDVNGDGKVDMRDAELLYEIALNGDVASDTTAFDFDGDGDFDIDDVQALIRIIDGV